MTDNENLQTTIEAKIKSAIMLLFQIAVLALSALWLMMFTTTWSLWSQFAVGGHFGMVLGIVLILATAALHVPKLAKSMSGKQKGLAFGGWFIALIIFISSFGNTLDTYYQTPEGRKEKAAMDADREAERELEARKAESAKVMADTQKAKDEYDAKMEQLERCFNWNGHRLDELEEAIQERLHNPDAFEHVETFAVPPNEEGYNVRIQFRAENAFGALRVSTASARVTVDSCEVLDVRFDDER